ncbi:TPA: ATP-binding protein, partial [Listeria monocytogenes]|nr:ATP-binding protein [Listeria monocytogenes]
QIVIFYANLIFGVNENKRGIFIVDEPELSLHLSWQKLFIEKTIELNKNIQFIFATHSPEIIGKYYNKTF